MFLGAITPYADSTSPLACPPVAENELAVRGEKAYCPRVN